jgi:AmmeMemoRadiSam system protein B
MSANENAGRPHQGEPGSVRPPAVAGHFYPDDPATLRGLVDDLLAEAARTSSNETRLAGGLAGLLVPHAGLAYSGLVAAVAWRLLGTTAAAAEPTVVLLGTNHAAAWLRGVGAWDGGPWRTPLGDLAIDHDLLGETLALGPPFEADGQCHLGEHSIEVQLPFVRQVVPGARIVPLAVGTGTGPRAVEAGERLGRLVAGRRALGESVVLAISTDMAHYPPASVAARVTGALLPYIVGLDPAGLAEAEARVRVDEPWTSCGMCGIEPAVLGLAALRAAGAKTGVSLAAATSADSGGDPGRTVGYLAVAFPAG